MQDMSGEINSNYLIKGGIGYVFIYIYNNNDNCICSDF